MNNITFPAVNTLAAPPPVADQDGLANRAARRREAATKRRADRKVALKKEK